MKKLIIFVVIILVAIGAYFYFQGSPEADPIPEVDRSGQLPDDNDDEDTDDEDVDDSQTVIGTSVEGNDITAYHFGDGDTELLFVGGIHGAYEWNTVLVAYELLDHLEDNPEVVPDNVRVTIVPVMNPDGLENVVGSTERFTQADVPASVDETIPGRFNANDVDLNRNFDCDWQEDATWQSRTVDGGSEVFSEPESRAIRDYVERNDIDAAVVWYSAAGGVFASNCHNGVMDETLTITNVFADASGYPAYESFDFYAITGDMVNWFAKEEIPAISVLLSTHEDVEWDMNKAGTEALLEYYSN